MDYFAQLVEEVLADDLPWPYFAPVDEFWEPYLPETDFDSIKCYEDDITVDMEYEERSMQELLEDEDTNMDEWTDPSSP